jgi:RNA recognition motif-containing protein
MAQKLFVGGIAFTTTSEGLRAFFAQSGSVVSADVVTDQATGRSRGFGFVEMETAEAAEQAVAQLNGRDLDGRPLRVEISKPKPAAGRSSGFGGGGGGRSGGGGNWR